MLAENESSGGFEKKRLYVDSLEAHLKSLRWHIPVSEKTSCFIDQVSYIAATLVFLELMLTVI